MTVKNIKNRFWSIISDNFLLIFLLSFNIKIRACFQNFQLWQSWICNIIFIPLPWKNYLRRKIGFLKEKVSVHKISLLFLSDWLLPGFRWLPWFVSPFYKRLMIKIIQVSKYKYMLNIHYISTFLLRILFLWNYWNESVS